jgi:GNAT superfamily N-acetyltransferase
VTLALRLGTRDDIPAIEALMEAAIRGLMKDFLTPEQVEGSFETMGLDTTLIQDGTYFAVADETGALVGCGGWSRRATLYGGNHAGSVVARDDRLLDPATEPARIRAMYTHPDHARRGIGRMILEAGEAAARAEGFKRAQLGATLAGEPLYRACGYAVVSEETKMSKTGVAIPLKLMEKTF